MSSRSEMEKNSHSLQIGHLETSVIPYHLALIVKWSFC